MPIPLQISFHNLDRSDAVERAIEERIAKLEQFSQDIMRCRVTVEAPHKHHAKGNIYHVVIDIHLPGTEIVVNRDRSKNHAHEDVYVAIRDAVNAAHRQLQDYVRVRRGKVKAHEPAQTYARISEIHPDRDFGRIETPDGRSVYFHRNSVIDAAFDKLEPGMEVRFAEEEGDEGPQASSLYLIS